MTTWSGFSFPHDLEREIFEMTSLLYPGFIPTLLRVCHRVRVWLEPLLYRVLVLSDSRRDPEHGLRIVASKPTAFLQKTVRHVLLKVRQAPEQRKLYASLLAKCSGTISLSIDGEVDRGFLRLLGKMRLQRLGFTVPPFFMKWNRAGFAHPLFVSVTHLDLYSLGHSDDHDIQKWHGITTLPVLSHLALSPSIATYILPSIVTQCPRLRAIVVTTHRSRSADLAFANSLALADERIVVMAIRMGYDDDWELGVRGGDDFWARAEAFLARKRAGKVESSCYFLDETPARTPPEGRFSFGNITEVPGIGPDISHFTC
ncbi:hypothetical protein MSAN_01816300 [Mycena sanguinolenta]|uniref:Uncharacterized protein n=1 Tax=Mycena sanguinolenta TaxID=230812 RepID=A0A8H6XSP3_9AGAR|nr:hypothetical protein MSAN_01816300 [Mycena sanguinolenta]